MLVGDINCVDVHRIFIPALIIANVHIISAHLPFTHQPVLGKSPVLEAICSVPLTVPIMPFVPELDGDLIEVALAINQSVDSSDSCKLLCIRWKQTLFAAKANSSLRSRYPFSLLHFLVRKSSMASLPVKNWSRLRQIESVVYAILTFAGFLWPA